MLLTYTNRTIEVKSQGRGRPHINGSAAVGKVRKLASLLHFLKIEQPL